MMTSEDRTGSNPQAASPQATGLDGRVLRFWIGLNALDAILTWISFAMGAAEGNVLLSSLASLRGPVRMLLVKFLVAVLIGSIIWRSQKWQLWPWLNWGMVGVVVWNMIIIGYAL